MDQQQNESRQNSGNLDLQALRAEEEPWLDQVYIQPATMNDFLSGKSMIFFGAPGSGRTALRLMMTKAVESSTKEKILIVNWLPEAPVEKMEGNQLARFAMRQLISIWVEAVVVTLSRNPDLLRAAPSFLRQGLAFIIHEYLAVDPQFYLLSRSHELPQNGLEEMMALLQQPFMQLLRKEATTQTTVNTITAVIAQFGFTSTWVFIDGLEKWHSGLQEQNRDMLAAMLDTLNYFDRRDIVFKVFVPSQYSGLYNSLGGVDRFRLFPQNLAWSENELLQILSTRARFMSGMKNFNFEQISSDQEMIKWLSDHAGKLPRWWLFLGRPFIASFVEMNDTQTTFMQLDREKWKSITHEFPPPLRIDAAAQQVLLGERMIDISPSGYNILRYLYGNAGRVCSREEVYYLAVCGKEEIPASTSKHYEEPTTWTSRLDTILWRLRKEIEPIPSQPVYVITMRDKGVCLQNFW